MNFCLHVCNDRVPLCNVGIYHASSYLSLASFCLVTERRRRSEIPSLEIGVGV